MVAHTPKHSYSREEVRRLLAVTERQLRNWERQSLIPFAESFSFGDLIALRALCKLRESRVSPDRIRRVLAAIRDKLRDVANPLTEVKIYRDGRRITVQIAGRRMEPISGQLLLDFDKAELSKLLAFPGKSGKQAARNDEAAAERARKLEAERWFRKGLDLEQSGAPAEKIIEAYLKSVEIDPESAGALVNLGTIYYNAQSWKKAEQYYTKALQADPKYALAHFNLGNLYDERGERAKALHHYLTAIELHPSYSDAHYNLALLYQSMGQTLKAVGHWKTYLKLDPSSMWATIARRELTSLQRETVVRGAGGPSLGPPVRRPL
ncbi:MAG: tetratricopeptide repeat protein [Bryobacteraceae bacterium]